MVVSDEGVYSSIETGEQRLVNVRFATESGLTTSVFSDVSRMVLLSRIPYHW